MYDCMKKNKYGTSMDKIIILLQLKVKSIYCKLSLTTDNSKRIIIKKRLGKIHFTRSAVGQPICILTVVLLLQ